MSASNKRRIWTGALILALTNAAVLIGVAYNRTHPPESVLTLTQRELGPQWSWMWQNGENSGLTLRLLYRTEPLHRPRPGNEADWPALFLWTGGATPWLDRDKLATLGFNVSVPPTNPDAAAYYQRLLNRDVLLVLELNGPTSERALQAARENETRREAAAAANPQDKSLKEGLQNAESALQTEALQSSRLFIVDAGLDSATLRARYRDRTHYAIIRGQIRPILIQDATSADVYGMVTAIGCADINIPLRFRSKIPSFRSPNHSLSRPDLEHPFQLNVAFGKHFEPWIL